MDLENDRQLIATAAARKDVLLNERLVLYAGANLPTAQAMKAYAPSLSAYPAMGPSHAKEQPDTDLVSSLEVAVKSRICDLFGGNWAEPRLPSCTIANLAVFHAFSNPGDLLLAPAAEHGGHLSQRRGGTPELAGLVVADLPFNCAEVRLDAAAAAEMVRQRRPKLVMLGRSVMIKPDDLAPVVEAAQGVGAKTIFDASHVSGLIAGGTFPNPLSLGIDIMTSSTYKTIPARPHGIIVGRHAVDGRRLARFIDRTMSANYDAGKLPSLLTTLIEVCEHGREYAQRVCANSEALSEALAEDGVTVIAPRPGETFTHQVLVPVDSGIPPVQAVAALERLGILVGTCPNPILPGAYSFRLGTQFVTSQGAESVSMPVIAKRFSDAFKTLKPSIAR